MPMRLWRKGFVYRVISGVGMAGVTGLKIVFFIPPQVQTAVIGTYAQQVVTRVVDYSRCLCPAFAPAIICKTDASFS